MKIFADITPYLPLIIIFGLLAFFGLIVIGVIIAKKKFTSLQIKKEEIDEQEAIQQELDRILVPVEDEEIKKEMDNARNEENK